MEYMSGKAKLAYDGECIVCREIAREFSVELRLDAIPVQEISSKYRLEHDAYLIVDDSRIYRGYSWIPYYLLKRGFYSLLLLILKAGYRIDLRYRAIKDRGFHPVQYLGRGKIMHKLLMLLTSHLIFSKLYRVIDRKRFRR